VTHSAPPSQPEAIDPGALFSIPTDAFKMTSDDRYTPRWVFDAMGLHFDLDVAAPIGGPWHVPCDRYYYTAEDDGLSQSWDGLVWCNPPYSSAEQWIARWADHDRGCLMTQVASRQSWRSTLYAAADAVYVGQVEFARPDGSTLKFGWTPICVAFRGVGTEPAERLAAADRFGAVLYGRRAA
jgi:hypothetical protein